MGRTIGTVTVKDERSRSSHHRSLGSTLLQQYLLLRTGFFALPRKTNFILVYEHALPHRCFCPSAQNEFHFTWSGRFHSLLQPTDRWHLRRRKKRSRSKMVATVGRAGLSEMDAKFFFPRPYLTPLAQPWAASTWSTSVLRTRSSARVLFPFDGRIPSFDFDLFEFFFADVQQYLNSLLH